MFRALSYTKLKHQPSLTFLWFSMRLSSKGHQQAPGASFPLFTPTLEDGLSRDVSYLHELSVSRTLHPASGVATRNSPLPLFPRVSSLGLTLTSMTPDSLRLWPHSPSTRARARRGTQHHARAPPVPPPYGDSCHLAPGVYRTLRSPAQPSAAGTPRTPMELSQSRPRTPLP